MEKHTHEKVLYVTHIISPENNTISSWTLKTKTKTTTATAAITKYDNDGDDANDKDERAENILYFVERSENRHLRDQSIYNTIISSRNISEIIVDRTERERDGMKAAADSENEHANENENRRENANRKSCATYMEWVWANFLLIGTEFRCIHYTPSRKMRKTIK